MISLALSITPSRFVPAVVSRPSRFSRKYKVRERASHTSKRLQLKSRIQDLRNLVVSQRPTTWLFRCEATSYASFRRRIIVLEWQRRELWVQVASENCGHPPAERKWCGRAMKWVERRHANRHSVAAVFLLTRFGRARKRHRAEITSQVCLNYRAGWSLGAVAFSSKSVEFCFCRRTYDCKVLGRSFLLWRIYLWKNGFERIWVGRDSNPEPTP